MGEGMVDHLVSSPGLSTTCMTGMNPGFVSFFIYLLNENLDNV